MDLAIHNVLCLFNWPAFSQDMEPEGVIPCMLQTLSLGHGTVFLYCHQVCRALHELGLQHVVWPDDARKVVI